MGDPYDTGVYPSSGHDTTTYVHDKIVRSHHQYSGGADDDPDEPFDDMEDGHHTFRAARRNGGYELPSERIKNYSQGVCFIMVSAFFAVLFLLLVSNYAELSATINHVHLTTGRMQVMTAHMNSTEMGLKINSIVTQMDGVLGSVEDRGELSINIPFPKKKKKAPKRKRHHRNDDDDDEEEDDEQQDEDYDDGIARRKPPTHPVPTPAPTLVPSPVSPSGTPPV